jgi:hypothetical protein
MRLLEVNSLIKNRMMFDEVNAIKANVLTAKVMICGLTFRPLNIPDTSTITSSIPVQSIFFACKTLSLPLTHETRYQA